MPLSKITQSTPNPIRSHQISEAGHGVNLDSACMGDHHVHKTGGLTSREQQRGQGSKIYCSALPQLSPTRVVKALGKALIQQWLDKRAVHKHCVRLLHECLWQWTLWHPFTLLEWFHDAKLLNGWQWKTRWWLYVVTLHNTCSHGVFFTFQFYTTSGTGSLPHSVSLKNKRTIDGIVNGAGWESTEL